jgi:hypothetical protein
MPNQDMLFPILPRPTPPVNLNDIIHHDVPKVEPQSKADKIDTEQHHPQQQQPHHFEAKEQGVLEEENEVAEATSTDSENEKHPEHIDIFI